MGNGSLKSSNIVGCPIWDGKPGLLFDYHVFFVNENFVFYTRTLDITMRRGLGTFLCPD